MIRPAPGEPPAASPYAGVRVTVLGATGFIGRWVARALAGADAELTLVVRDRAEAERQLRQSGVAGRVVVADLAHPRSVRDLLAECRPAVVFNLIGYGVDASERDPAASAALNAHLPPALAEAMAGALDGTWVGQHVVHAGSALEYGTAAGDLEEGTTATPTTLYGRTKLDGTLRLDGAARRLGVRAVTARLFTVYGPGEHDGRLLPSILAGAATDGPIRLSAGTQQRDFTFVADVAEGLLRLGARPLEGIGVVNLATGELATVRRFVEVAAHVAGIAPERLAFGALPSRADDMQHRPVNVARLRALTGWAPATTIAEGVAATLRVTSREAAPPPPAPHSPSA